jgi:TonB family protein
MSFVVMPTMDSFIRWGRLSTRGMAMAGILLGGWTACAQSGEGYWIRKGEPIFVGRDGGSAGWTWKIDGHSPSHIALTSSCGGDTTISVRAEWDPPPKILRAGKIHPLRGAASFQGIVNPRNFSMEAEFSCYLKTPYRRFWAVSVPMESSKQVRGSNTNAGAWIPGQGGNLTLVYSLFFSTGRDMEFPYEWVKGVPPSTVDPDPPQTTPVHEPVPQPERRKKSAARFSGMNGQVEVHRAGWPEDRYIIAKLDMILEVGDRIKTDEDSDCILSFADMSTFRLKADSEVEITTPPDKDSKIALVAGNIWVNMKKLWKDGSMEIDLNQAVAGIKGTTLVCSTSKTSSTLKVLEGSVAFKSKSTGKRVMVGAGEAVTATREGLSAKTKFDVAALSKEWDAVRLKASGKVPSPTSTSSGWQGQVDVPRADRTANPKAGEVLDVDFSRIKLAFRPPNPPYPTLAKAMKVQGTVVVEISVGLDGAPTTATALEGPAELRPAAERYALQWRFEPAQVGGKPQKARIRLTVPFKLNGTSWDFESDGLSGWTQTGDAFKFQPTFEDNPTARNRGQASNHQGQYWIGTCEKRPLPSDPPGQIQGDGPQGTLTSQPFTIQKPTISFLIGGGCDISVERVELFVDGQVVKRATGNCTETMERIWWTVSEFIGKEAQIRLVDASSGGWGHINFDDVKFEDVKH